MYEGQNEGGQIQKHPKQQHQEIQLIGRGVDIFHILKKALRKAKMSELTSNEN